MTSGSKDVPASAHAAIAAFEIEKHAHLAKLSWEKGAALLEKCLMKFFNRQNRYSDPSEFRIHLETVVEEYVGYYVSSLENKASPESLARMDAICREFHEMLYDGEVDPYQEESARKQAEVVKDVGALGRISRLLGW